MSKKSPNRRENNFRIRRCKRSFLKLFFVAAACIAVVGGCRKVADQMGIVNVCPVVVSTSPEDSALAVPVDAPLLATFNEPIDSTTLNAATFKVYNGATPVAGRISYKGSTATFVPTGNLAVRTKYTVTLTTGIRDLAHSAMISDYVWTFTTGNGPDLTPPTVTSTDPTNDATNVALNKKIVISFSERLDSASAATGFTLYNTTGGNKVVSGIVSYTGTTIVFTPQSDLLPDITYTGIVGKTVKDVSGNQLASEYTWTFTTGANTDITTPTVIATVPADATVEVALNTRVTAVFSETMDPATINFASFTLKMGATVVPGAVTYTGISATFIPSTNLLPNTKYTATITTDVKDLAGNAMANPYVWTFTTGANFDVIRPFVTATDPLNGATNVAYSKVITVGFSEAMDPLSLNTGSFLIKNGNTVTQGIVTYNGTTATFTPSADLLPGTRYDVTITTNAKDLAGNSLAVNYTFAFTTTVPPDTTPPTVISVNPFNGAVNVPISKIITGTFSEAMDPASINTSTFTVRAGATNIAGVVTYNNRDAIFTPAIPLTNNMLYTATLTTGSKDIAGNSLVNNFAWNFTTVTATIPPPVLGSIAIFGAFGAGGVVNQGTNSVINGSVGSTAASTLVTGFHEGVSGDIYTETNANRGNVTGRVYTAPPAPGSTTSLTVATQALAGAVAAYNSASPASKPNGTDPNAGQLGGLTLTAGVYKAASGTFTLTNGNLILDAKGDPNALFVFQTVASLNIGTTGTARSVVLVNGALAANVFWYVGTSATINPSGGGVMTGTVIAAGLISVSSTNVTTQSVVNGRVLSIGGNVKIVNTTINVQ